MLIALGLLALGGGPTVTPVFACDDVPALRAVWERTVPELRAQGWTLEETPAHLREPPRRCGDGHAAALELLVQGRRSFTTLDFASAEASLTEAVRLLWSAPSFIGAREAFIEAHLYLAWIASESGEPKRSRDHLTAVLRLDPEVSIDARRFPPPVISALANTAAQVRKTMRPFTVTAEPTDAEIFIDGALRGRGSVTIAVPAGDHLVEVRHAALRPETAHVQLKVEQLPWESHSRLAAEPRSALLAAVAAQDAEGARAVLNDPAVSKVVVMAPGAAPGQVVCSILTLSPPLLAPPLHVDGKEPAAATTRLAGALGVATAGPTPIAMPAAVPERTSHWVWPAVAVGAFAVATTVVLLALPDHRSELRP